MEHSQKGQTDGNHPALLPEDSQRRLLQYLLGLGDDFQLRRAIGLIDLLVGHGSGPQGNTDGLVVGIAEGEKVLHIDASNTR